MARLATNPADGAARSHGPTPIEALRGVRPYAVPSVMQPVDLWLDANESLSVQPGMLAPLREIGVDEVRRYPARSALEAELARMLGVEPSRVIATCGGDEALDRIIRAYSGPGRELLVATPTFEMIPRYAALADATINEVPWPHNGAYPIDAMLAGITDATAIIAVVTPNNPTGAGVGWDAIERLAEAAPNALLLLDHAYAEFADEDHTARALELSNAVVVRTLSKAYGMAGARVGYAVGAEQIIATLKAAGGPFNVPSPSLRLALERVRGSDDQVRDTVDRIRTERDELCDLLGELGCEVTRSQANFVFARTPHAQWIASALRGLGIAVRAWPGRPGYEDAVRITCPGVAPAFGRLTHALRAALAPRAIIFDMDGILADDSGSYRQGIIDTASRFGVTVGLDHIFAAKARGNANDDWALAHALINDAGRDVTLDEVIEVFEELYQGTPGTPGLCASEALLVLDDSLASLAQRVPLGIVTGRPRKDAEAFLERNTIAHHFSAIVCIDDGLPGKPDPAPVRRAMERLGVEHAWMIGDMPDDQRAARAAGVVPIGAITPGEQAEAMREPLLKAGASLVLDRSADLVGLFERVAGGDAGATERRA